MSEKGKQILEIFGKAIPDLSEMERKKLLAFGEGMAFMVDQRKNSPRESGALASGKETA